MSVTTDDRLLAETHPAAKASGFDWPLIFIAWIVSAVVLVARAKVTAGTVPLVNDTDDAMRLDTVHDLLAGQGWWDHLQHRLNVPSGAEIHWTHIIDAMIGGLMLLFRPFLGASAADTVTVYVYPMLLLFLLLTLCGRLAYVLVGREAILPAVILPLVSPALITEFSPGRVDHHSIQILMTLLMAWGAIEALEKPRFAALAGVAAAASLGVGIEGLPSIISALVAVAIAWVVRPERAPALRWFAVPFALGTVALQIDQYPPNRWFEAACDEISFVYVAFAVGTAAGLLLLAGLPLAHFRPRVRLAAGAIVGAALALALAKAFPPCLKGPYAALDPWLVTNGLDHIAEAKTLVESLAGFDAFTIGAAVPPLLGLVVIAVRLWRAPEGRGPWLVLGVFLLIADAVMLVQVRGARLASPLALPAAAWLILVARQHYLAHRQLGGIAGLLGAWLGFAGFVLAVIAALATMPFDANAQSPAAGKTIATASDGGRACLMPAAFGPLAQLPATRVLTPIDLGSHALLYTPHSVVSAPYHRDQAGVRDTFRFFNDPIAEARQIVAARGITLVVVCPGMSELRGLADAAPDSFVKLYAAQKLPDWLKALSAPGDTLQIYAVLPG